MRQLLAVQPKNPHALYALAQIAIKSNAKIKAIYLLEQCVPLISERHEPLLQLAELFQKNSQLIEAEDCYQQLLTRFSGLSKIHFSYAGFLQSIGDRTKTEEKLRKTLELEPEHTAAMLALSGLYKITINDPLVQQMQTLLKQLQMNSGRDWVAEMHLHYALGKSFDDLKSFQLAFHHWQNANEIQLKQCHFRVSQMLPFYSQLKISFNQITLSSRNIPASQSITPIFIVGMPRTGSTLLEQMLSSHSDIESVGEVNYISEMIVTKTEELTGSPYPIGIERLSAKQLLSLGSTYLQSLTRDYPDAEFIIDKLPANFQSIGLIKLILPNAKIINLSRNPLATGLSIYRNYFAENEPYFCDLNEYVDYYLAYIDLMEHWKQVLKIEIIELSYEVLIRNPKQQLERILKSFGINWQESCLEFHRNKKQVLTLSATQVQEPLYATSVDSWKNYAQFLSEIERQLVVNNTNTF